MANSTDDIQTWFNGKSVSRADVLAWEAKRATKGLRRFGVDAAAGDLAAQRTALAAAKLAIGRDAIENQLAREIRISDRLTGMLARASRGRRRFSQVELLVPWAKAAELPAWYAEKTETDDELAFLAATPDHHLFRSLENPKRQEVWETTGGSPVASRFFIEIDSDEGLRSQPDPAYPIQLFGCAKLANGTVLGGIRHQFRDEPEGARVPLAHGSVRARCTSLAPCQRVRQLDPGSGDDCPVARDTCRLSAQCPPLGFDPRLNALSRNSRVSALRGSSRVASSL